MKTSLKTLIANVNKPHDREWIETALADLKGKQKDVFRLTQICVNYSFSTDLTAYEFRTACEEYLNY